MIALFISASVVLAIVILYSVVYYRVITAVSSCVAKFAPLR